MNATKPANERQISYLKRLAGERQMDSLTSDRLWKLLEAHEIDVRTPGDGSPISSKNASAMIDWLLTRPRSQDTGERHDRPAELGVYRKDDRIYIVREFTPEGETEKVRYARELVELRDTQDDRVNEAGEAVRYEEVKAPGMQWRLTDADLMPLEDFKRLSLRYRRCIACGAKLEVKESIEAGIGPVCGGRQRRRLAAAS